MCMCTNAMYTNNSVPLISFLYVVPPEFPSDHVRPTNSNCTLGNNNYLICASIPGTRLEFICNVTGNPTPSLNHSFSDGTPTVSAVGNIVIDPVMSSSAGNYSCVTSSSAFPLSSSTRRFELYVGGEFMINPWHMHSGACVLGLCVSGETLLLTQTATQV